MFLNLIFIIYFSITFQSAYNPLTPAITTLLPMSMSPLSFLLNPSTPNHPPPAVICSPPMSLSLKVLFDPICSISEGEKIWNSFLYSFQITYFILLSNHHIFLLLCNPLISVCYTNLVWNVIRSLLMWLSFLFWPFTDTTITTASYHSCINTDTFMIFKV